jgi:hypothetical protein
MKTMAKWVFLNSLLIYDVSGALLHTVHEGVLLETLGTP